MSIEAQQVVTPLAALKQALEALEKCRAGFEYTRQYVGYETLPAIEGWSWYDGDVAAVKAITSLRQAIAEAEKQEPVAWMYPDDYERMLTNETFCTVYSVEVGSPTRGESTVALYTSPPKHEPCPYVVSTKEGTHHCALSQRQPLTDEQLQQVMDAEEVNGNIAVAFARAIETAHGIKGEA